MKHPAGDTKTESTPTPWESIDPNEPAAATAVLPAQAEEDVAVYREADDTLPSDGNSAPHHTELGSDIGPISAGVATSGGHADTPKDHEVSEPGTAPIRDTNVPPVPAARDEVNPALKSNADDAPKTDESKVTSAHDSAPTPEDTGDWQDRLARVLEAHNRKAGVISDTDIPPLRTSPEPQESSAIALQEESFNEEDKTPHSLSPYSGGEGRDEGPHDEWANRESPSPQPSPPRIGEREPMPLTDTIAEPVKNTGSTASAAASASALVPESADGSEEPDSSTIAVAGDLPPQSDLIKEAPSKPSRSKRGRKADVASEADPTTDSQAYEEESPEDEDEDFQPAVWDISDAGESAEVGEPALVCEDPELGGEPAPAVSGASWTIPALCLGIALIAFCIVIPQADANRRMAYEKRMLQADLESVQKQVAVNDEFLKKVVDDPGLAERLAQRQLKRVRKGQHPLRLDEEKPEMSPFQITDVPPPPLPPPYEPPKGIMAGICRDPRARLYTMGIAMALIAAGLVIGASPGNR